MKQETANFIVVFIFINLMIYSFLAFPLSNDSLAHNFTPNDFAAYLALSDEFLVEMSLINSNLANGNLTLAKEHSEKASKLFYRNVVDEVGEIDRPLAENLTNSVEKIQNLIIEFTTETASNTTGKNEREIRETVSYVDAKITDVITTAISRQQQDQASNSIFDEVVELISNVFNMNKTNSTNESSTIEIEALRLADLVDISLQNYGGAFNVAFDMTDMTNMGIMNNMTSVYDVNMTDKNKDIGNTDMDMVMNMSTMNPSSSDKMNMHIHNTVVNTADLQSAQALAEKAKELFNSNLKPFAITAEENSTNSLANLEDGITQLDVSMKNKVPPMDIMMIVHSKIHPNLLTSFALEQNQ